MALLYLGVSEVKSDWILESATLIGLITMGLTIVFDDTSFFGLLNPTPSPATTNTSIVQFSFVLRGIPFETTFFSPVLSVRVV